ncbi:MAG: hypothetical protein AAGB34_04475, partial [Planctomycetota bacterium]
ADIFFRISYPDAISPSLGDTYKYVSLLSTMSVIALLMHLRVFARRIPDNKLRIGSIIAASLFGFSALGDVYLFVPRDLWFAIPGGFLFVHFSYMLSLVAVVWFAVLLIRFFNRILALRREQKRFQG